MTVRSRLALTKDLERAVARRILAVSHVTGQLHVQAAGFDGKQVAVFLPSTVGKSTVQPIDLLEYAPQSSWKVSRTLLSAVRAGLASVDIET